MDSTNVELLHRVEVLERRMRRRDQFSLVLAVLATLMATSFGLNAQDARSVRVRSLIVEDEQGRDRIVLGSPVPNPKEGQRASASTGMVINDANGYERFGLGLMQDDRVVMGFDAPPNTGDPRNRERINIVADQAGGAYVRFLDRRTLVAGRLNLDSNNRLWLEFLDVLDKEVVTRRIGLSGEETVRAPR